MDYVRSLKVREDEESCVMRYLPLYKAVLADDWEIAKRIFKEDETAATAKITYWKETPLHVAVGTNRSHRFMEQLVEWIALRDPEKLRIPEFTGCNSLHYAAKSGNTRAVKLLVEKDPEMAQIPTSKGETPLALAARYAHKEAVRHLLNVTKDCVYEDGNSPFSGVAGADLINSLITADMYDVVLDLVEKYPNLATEKDKDGCTAFQKLASKPHAFPSGNQGWFCKIIFCSCIHIKQDTVLNYPVERGNKNEDDRGDHGFPSWRMTIDKNKDEAEKNANQNEDVQPGERAPDAGQVREEENPLHMIGKLAPPYCLNTVTGAALQMQHLQWFKEVEKFVESLYKEALNRNGTTPKIVFTDEHSESVKKGEQRMKDKASSSILVAMLIVTVSFVAAFTVPDGTPLYFNNNVFTLFAISDAIAISSSSTSLLMFLSILTSRFAEEDFLCDLPKRLMIGLLFLFLSIAATMITFIATLALMLHTEMAIWIALPLVSVACVPVTLFVLLRFPLLVELVYLTYRPSIFCQQSKLLLH